MAAEQRLLVTDEEIAQYIKVFDSFDTDRNGQLSRDELREMLRVSKMPNKPTVESIIRLADENGDGVISKQEFLQALFGCSREQTYSYMFRCFDTDGDGKVDAKEILVALGECETERNMKAAHDIIADLDKDGDGLLDPDEFALLFTKIGSKNL